MTEAQSAGVPNNPTPPEDPNKGQQEGVAQRPDNVPEKFWDAEKGELRTDDLLKSYGELEKGQSQEQDGETPPKEQNHEVEGFIDSALKKAGVDRDVLTKEMTDNGTLSEKSYEDLAKAGFSRGEVDAYLKGLGAMNSQDVQEGAAATEAEINSLITDIGDGDLQAGQRALQQMQEWASEGGMSEAQLEVYNEMVSSGDKQKAEAGLTYMQTMYEASEGKAPQLIGGGPDGSDYSVYRSEAEVTAAMADPRYATDPAYRDDVVRKISRSKVFGR